MKYDDEYYSLYIDGRLLHCSAYLMVVSVIKVIMMMMIL